MSVLNKRQFNTPQTIYLKVGKKCSKQSQKTDIYLNFGHLVEGTGLAVQSSRPGYVSVLVHPACPSPVPRSAYRSEHQHLPARVREGTAKIQAIHCLIQQPIKYHFPVARANCNPKLEAGPVVVIVGADWKQVDHFHVEGHGGAHSDGWQLVGHLFPVDKHSAYRADSTLKCEGVIFHR